MSKKEELITTAASLFCERGINSSGIDLILSEAQISKMTLYNNFQTKENLIISVLQYSHDLFVENVIEKLDKLKLSPKLKIVKFFELVEKSITAKKASRCLFIAASIEFPQLNNPIHKESSKHKLMIEAYIKNLLKAANQKNCDYLSQVIFSLIQGAILMYQITGKKSYFLNCKKALNLILKM